MEREMFTSKWIDDLKDVLYNRIKELHLNSVDYSRGRVVDGRYKFWFWDMNGHKIAFDICQIKGAKGWLEASRSEKPDKDRLDPLDSLPSPLFKGEIDTAYSSAGAHQESDVIVSAERPKRTPPVITGDEW